MLWRFIPPLSASGSVQMAIDAWLLAQHLQQQHPPTLRFYTWKPVAISLGYHQRRYPEHWRQLVWDGQAIDLVNRPTGGRAVLHQGDLTYAIVTSGLATNRMAAYQQLCEFLIGGWRSLGIDLFYGEAGRGYIHNPNCFGTATVADLVTTEGAKLIGSAQLRRGSAVLQHGSMRLNQSAELFQTVFGVEPQLPKRLGLSSGESAETVIAALTAAAQESFKATFQIEPLSDAEWQAILQT